MIRIAGLRALSDRLARLDMARTQQAALEQAAQTLRDAVRDALSTPPGGDHATPWRRTGSLQSSIEHRSDATTAVVGSDDPVAVAQELGTSRIPPRPFLAPTAAAHAQGVAHQVAAAVAGAIGTAIGDATKGPMP